MFNARRCAIPGRIIGVINDFVGMANFNDAVEGIVFVIDMIGKSSSRIDTTNHDNIYDQQESKSGHV
jgi:hypothetical protein